MLHTKREVKARSISGFQSPADDHAERRLDIIDSIVIDQESTFYVQMTNNSMLGFGIQKGSILVVDRSLEPVNEAIVLVFYNQTFYTRKYITKGEERWLLAGSTNDEPIKLKTGDDCILWGVVLVNINLQLPPQLMKGRYAHVCSC